jgi:hypothetical protein
MMLVIPAKAGIHFESAQNLMDSRFRGNDHIVGFAGMTVLLPSPE